LDYGHKTECVHWDAESGVHFGPVQNCQCRWYCVRRLGLK
jgi:hypothetical protein